LGESTELEYTDVDAQLVSHQAEASKDMDSVDLLKLLIYGYLARLTLKNWDIMECWLNMAMVAWTFNDKSNNKTPA